MSRVWVITGLVLVCGLGAGVAAGTVEADDVLGEWVTAGGESRVEVIRRDDLYCGSIVGLIEPFYGAGERSGMDGVPRVDVENPDKKLRDRPLLGLEILRDFRFEEDKWVGGRVYDPKNGKTYRCELRLEGSKLKVRGYIGVSWLGRTTEWERADGYYAKVLRMLGKAS